MCPLLHFLSGNFRFSEKHNKLFYLILALELISSLSLFAHAPMYLVSTPASNQSPIISITSPAANTSYQASASITIAAQAIDYDGTISKVEFFNGTTKLGEDFSSPYSFSWTTLPSNNSSFNITVKATDNIGAVTASSVNVIIYTTVAPYYPLGIVDPQNLTYLNGVWYFTSNYTQECIHYAEGTEYCISKDHAYQFWRSDGTANGTIMLYAEGIYWDVEDGYQFDYSYIKLKAVENTLYFIGWADYYIELRKIVNTTTEYTVLKSFESPWGFDYNFTSLNGTLFLTVSGRDEEYSGIELWKSNGTPESTVLVKDINPGDDSEPKNLYVKNGLLYFTADDGLGRRLWKSDGTEIGTVKVMGAPQAPSLPSLNVISRTAIELPVSTEDCGNTSFYVIERALTANGPFASIDTLTLQCNESNPGFADNYLLPNTTYYYRVKAVNDLGYSPYSTVVSATTMANVTSPVNATAEWNKRFGGTQDETLQTALPTSDGGYLLAGSSRSGLDGDRSETIRGGLDFWIVKIAANGNKLWDKRFGGTSYDGLNAAIQTSDGGFLLGGTSSSVIGGDKSEGNKGAGDYWIVKITSAGVKQWDKTFGGSALDELRSVIQTTDGGYLIGGYSLSGISGNKTEGSRGESDYWVVKITESGVKQWDKRFGGVAADEINSMIQTLDGNYILGGTSLSSLGGDIAQNTRDTENAYSGKGDYWIIKINTSGIKIWDKRYGGKSADQLKTIIQNTDGSLLLGGSSKSIQSGDKSESSTFSYFWGGNDPNFCYWIVKISSLGEKIWDKTFYSLGDQNHSNDQMHSYLSSLIQTPDGGYIISGSSQSDKSIHKSEPSRGVYIVSTEDSWYSKTSYSFDYWMIKVSNNGIREWDKTFGGFGEDNLSASLYNPDGSILLAGYSTSAADGDKTELSRGKTDFWVLKTNPTTQPPVTCTASGTILREVWSTITGTAVSTIPLSTSPTTTSQLTLFETPTNAGDNYGQRIRGYICVPQNGNYTFWIAGDDNCELWLSTSDQPVNKIRIAHITGTNAWAGVREWSKYTTQKSASIALQAGKRYYIEALHKENTGGDNLAVGWQLPNGTLELPIPGSRLSPVILANQAPVVNITSPAANAGFVAPASITINVSASDTDGLVSKVEFFNGITKLGEDMTSPYSFSLFNVAVGTYLITAKAFDNLGASKTSTAVNFTVSQANKAPVVSITSPANNSSFIAPASIIITASATDADGSIAKVEFYRGATKLGEDLTSPYNYSWQSVTSGSYGLTAKAIDNLGTITTSSTININISVQASCTASGTILREVWNNIVGVEVSAIPLTTMPSTTSQLTSFEAPTNAGTSYGQRIRGYICVPLTGNYTFYIAGDDNCELWLSTTDLPANKIRIAHITGTTAWAGVRQWNKFTTQKSASISLQAGRRYYIEALHKENSVGDNLAVGWQLAGATNIDVIPGSVLSPFVPTTATSIARVGEQETVVDQLNIYPNPFENKLNITTSQAAKLYISLTDNLGRTVFQTTTQALTIETELDLAKLKPGLYLIKVTSEGGSTQMQKVVKK